MHPSISIAVLTGLIAAIFAAPTTRSSAGFIITTEVTPSYWRATFSDPPLNTLNTAFFTDLFALIDRIANDSDVKVLLYLQNIYTP